MKQVTKTLLMLALVATSAFTIGSALARPPGGGTLPPQPPQPPIDVRDVWTCYYQYEIVQFETPCPSVYNGQRLENSFYGPPII